MIEKKEGFVLLFVVILIVLIFLGSQLYNNAIIQSYSKGKIDGLKEVCFKNSFTYVSQNQTFNISQDVYCNIQLNGEKK